MNLSAFAHVMIHFEILGGFKHVLFGFSHITQSFKVESEIQVGVATMVL
jgi:hypothetical protein